MAGEEEQIVALKKWWSENGKSTLAGLGIGLAAVVGWQSWQTWDRSQAELASERYEQLVADATADRHAQALSGAEALTEEFPDSAYASFASLIAARAAVQTGDPGKAKEHLQRVVENAAFPELVPIARLRLARLMFEAREYDGALAELGRIESAPFHDRVKELQGDIHHARGDSTAARESYETVLADAELSPSTRVRVRMKLDDLGEYTSPPSS